MDPLTKAIVGVIITSVGMLYLMGSLSNFTLVIAMVVIGVFIGYMSGGNEEKETDTTHGTESV